MNHAKTEAIANADAHLNDAGLPTFTQLCSLAVRLDDALRAIRSEERDGSEDDVGTLLDGAINILSALPASEPPAPHFVLVQEGGSSCELYIHAHESREDAEHDRLECDGAAYRTTPITEVPGDLASHPAFYDVLETVVRSTLALGYSDDEGED